MIRLEERFEKYYKKLEENLSVPNLDNLIFYHGTRATFDKFELRPSNNNYGLGIYLTTYKNYAQHCGHIVFKCKIHCKKPFLLDFTNPRATFNNSEFFNTELDIPEGSTMKELSNEVLIQCIRRRDELIKKIPRHGYDCLLVKGDKSAPDGYMALVYNPDNIEIIDKEIDQNYNSEILGGIPNL